MEEQVDEIINPKKEFIQREFLNDDTFSWPSIMIVHISKEGYVEITFKDCQDSIRLHNGTENVRERKNIITKLLKISAMTNKAAQELVNRWEKKGVRYGKIKVLEELNQSKFGEILPVNTLLKSPSSKKKQ